MFSIFSFHCLGNSFYYVIYPIQGPSEKSICDLGSLLKYLYYFNGANSFPFFTVYLCNFYIFASLYDLREKKSGSLKGTSKKLGPVA